MEKIGLVLEGGGVRGAYTAGALAWLQDNNISFDYSVGISSGAVYLSCFLCGNKETPKNLATVYATDPKVVGAWSLLKNGHYVDYAKVFNEDLLGKEKLSMQKIIDEKPDMEVGVYDLELGKTVYYGPEAMDDQLTILRGAASLPVASAIVDYKGRKLLDGGITKMIPIERALEKGCTKCLVIMTKPRDYVRKTSSPAVLAMMKVIYSKYPMVCKDYAVRHLNYYKQMDLINRLVEEGKAIDVRPSKDIPVSRWKGDKAKCEELYQLGYTDMEELKPKLMEFMKKEDDHD